MPTTKESMIEVINVALNNQRELANKDAEAKKLLCDFLGISSAGDTDKTLSEILKKFIPKLRALFNNIS